MAEGSITSSHKLLTGSPPLEKIKEGAMALLFQTEDHSGGAPPAGGAGGWPRIRLYSSYQSPIFTSTSEPTILANSCGS